jgi:hypothetical protein
VHFGSRYPGEDISIYDILPTGAFDFIRNRDHFFGAAVLDTWISNADRRQAVFVGSMRRGFQAIMIDFSEAFDGVGWTFTDRELPNIPEIMRGLYSPLTSKAVEPWLHRVTKVPEQAIQAAAAAVPEEWVQEDRAALGQLLERLIQRQHKIGEIVDAWLRPWLFTTAAKFWMT